MPVISKKRLSDITIEPTFRTYDVTTQELRDRDVGQDLRAVINYRVIEKTKSFTVLKITFIHVINARRAF